MPHQQATALSHRAQQAVQAANPYDALNHPGFTYFPAAATRKAVSEIIGVPVDEQVFWSSWDRLSLDEYMADGGTYRTRSFDTFEVREPNGTLFRTEPRPHFQHTDFNQLNGGVFRLFEPAEDEFVRSEAFQTLLEISRAAFERTSDIRRWRCETHQFRITTSADETGQPTPEGKHRDGVDFGFILLGRRVNVRGGETTIEDDAGNLLAKITMQQPFEWILFNDWRIRHAVSAITPVDPARPAYRDTLVVTFKALP